MGIFNRLENVIKSYLTQEDERIFGRPRGADPDLEEAEAELESFLRNGGAWSGGDWSDNRTTGRARSGDWGDNRTTSRDWTGNRGAAGSAPRRDPAGPPEELRPDFAELGLPFGAGAEECKAAYRRLLKLHHPDRHAGHQGNMEKATKKMAKINAAYDRIEKWRAKKPGAP
ncbi:MAG: J domain-containing protein [Treponema sp.]|nr:J domain-containing protein [Treponema sp.]